MVRLALSPAQDDFLYSEKKLVGFIGGRGSGKTFIGVDWWYSRCCTYPLANGLITANTFDQLHQSTLPPLFKFLNDNDVPYVFNKNPPWFTSRFERHNNVLSLPNGSQTVCRSLDKFETIRGAEYGFWWADETRDTKREAYEVALACLRDQNGPLEIRFTSTPRGYDWLHDLLVAEVEKKPELGFRRQLIESSSYDNVDNLPDGFIEDLKENYSENLAQQEIFGKFINLQVGQAYSCFSRKDHVVANAITTYDPMLPLVLACDFNVTPMCWVIGQPHGKLFGVIAEIWRESANSGESATQSAAKEFVARFGRHTGGLTVFGDASGDNEHSATTATNYKVLAQVIGLANMQGVKFMVPTENPPVQDRVEFVNAALRNVKGEIRLFINPRCAKLIRDLERVVWRKTGELDQTTDKTLTHISDALGYWLMQALRPARIKPRVSGYATDGIFKGYD